MNKNHWLLFALLTPCSALSAETISASFQDCDVCPVMVPIPAGGFVVEAPKRNSLISKFFPAKDRKVDVPAPIAVGKYEVTFENWDACVAEGGCGSYRPVDDGWGRGNMPVRRISWDDANKYTEWLSSKTGKKYRLLTGDEWEYSAKSERVAWERMLSNIDPLCSSGSNGYEITDPVPDLFCQNQETYYKPIADYAWFGEFGNSKPHPVGSKSANAFGLHDLIGNVWEWTSDCWKENCDRRVTRGGAWSSDPRFYIRPDYREMWFEKHVRYDNQGFRVARDLPLEVVQTVAREIKPVSAPDPEKHNSKAPPPVASGLALKGGEIWRSKLTNIPLLSKPDGNVVNKLSKGEEVVATGEEQGDYIKVIGAGGEGWVRKLLLEQ